ncbi:MAG: hypothetical protein E7464_00040 [Ruminococcaceae bacterium]|nr:hypothetical protein [Oscillospiraceae bacterium]
MSLMNNRYSFAIAAAAALIVGACLCTVSVVWTPIYCVTAPMLLSYTLQRYEADRDNSEEYEDPDGNYAGLSV